MNGDPLVRSVVNRKGSHAHSNIPKKCPSDTSCPVSILTKGLQQPPMLAIISRNEARRNGSDVGETTLFVGEDKMGVKWYEDIISQRMKMPRFKHSKNVAKEAVRLAKKYGADVDKAELAGILHDATKETSEQEQMDLIARAGIVLTKMERESPKLWHAISGSAYIQVELGINDQEIIDAIRYQTTGRAGMTLLDKVLFIADFISADRDYDGVDKMRKAADKNLDEACLEGMAFTIADLAERKITIAPDTLAGYNELAAMRAKVKKS